MPQPVGSKKGQGIPRERLGHGANLAEPGPGSHFPRTVPVYPTEQCSSCSIILWTSSQERLPFGDPLLPVENQCWRGNCHHIEGSGHCRNWALLAGQEMGVLSPSLWLQPLDTLPSWSLDIEPMLLVYSLDNALSQGWE